MKLIFKILICVIASLIMISSCSSRIIGEYSTVYGKNKKSQAGRNIELFEDGTFKMHTWSDMLGTSIEGKGEFVFSSHGITLQYKGNNQNIKNYLEKPNLKKRKIRVIKILDSQFVKVEEYGEKVILFLAYINDDLGQLIRGWESDPTGKLEINLSEFPNAETLHLPSLYNQEFVFKISEIMSTWDTLEVAEHMPFVKDGTIEQYVVRRNGKRLVKTLSNDREQVYQKVKNR